MCGEAGPSVRKRKDFDDAKSDIELVLTVLEAMHLHINFRKTAVLLRLVGKDAKRILQQHTSQQAGQTHLHLEVSGRHCTVPVKLQHEYLGTAVAYQGRISGNMRKRQQAGQLRYQAIRRTLVGRHILSTEHRISLWRSCVSTSLMYSVPFVGCHPKSLLSLDKSMTKHLRAILRKPAHIGHDTNHHIWTLAQVDRPHVQALRLLEAHLTKLKCKLCTAPDITTTTEALEYAEGQLRAFQRLAESQVFQDVSHHPAETAAACVPCVGCEQMFPSLNAMRIHCKLSHGFLPEHTKTPLRFDATLHSVNGMPECKLCRRRFFRWQHLKKHIEEGACSALGGESQVRKPVSEEACLDLPTSSPPPGPPTPPSVHHPTPQHSPPPVAPPLSETASSITPLVRNPDFCSTLSRWEAWPLRPGARKSLLEHCVLCGMWLASFRHVKQHVHKAHDQEVKHLLQPALQLCRTFKSQLTRGRNCLYCHNRVGAPARHAEQCTVLFQLTIAKLAAQASTLPHDGGPGQSRGGHLSLLLSERGASSGGAVDPSAAQNAQAPPPRVWATTAGLPLSAPAQLHGATPGQRASQAGQQDPPAARGLHSADQAGSSIRDVHAGRSAKPATGHDGHGQRMEPEEGQRGSIPGVTVENGANGQRDQGNSPADANRCGYGGGAQGPEASPMVDRRRSLGVSEVVPQVQAADSGCIPPGPSARRSGQAAQHAPLPDEGRDRSDFQKSSAPSQARRTGSHLSGFQARDQPARTGGDGSSRSTRPIHQQLGDGSRRDVVEARAAQSGAHEQAAGPAGVRQLGSEPHVATATPESQPQPKPSFRFANPSNLCYINSALYCIWLVAYHTRHMHILPRALQGGTTGSLKARQLLGFRLLGWSHPERQHDVSEFLAFLLPKMSAGIIQGRVEMRQSLTEGLRVQPDCSLQQCIILPDTPRHSRSLQALLNFWHQQEARHALSSAEPWLFVQLPRFAWSRGRARKTQQSYDFVTELQVPVFCEADSLEVRWVTYCLRAVIQHHGHSPAAGHYTVIQLGVQQHWLIDDEKDPRALDSDMYAHACANMYVLVMTCLTHAGRSSLIEPPFVDTNHAEAYLCADQRPPQGGNGLACSAALSSGVSAASDRSRHGNAEPDIQQHASQTAYGGASG